MANLINLTGKKFGYFTVLRKDNTKYNEARWICKCICGKEISVSSKALRNGRSKSCGCKKPELFKKDMALKRACYPHKKELRFRYEGIKQRCYNKNNPSYKNYGERGIVMCDLWKNNFMSFYNWSIENGYKKNLTIDRIDVEDNYCPENCRWVDRKCQSRNKRGNVFYDFCGKKMTLPEICEITNKNYKNVYKRVKKYGWRLEDAIKRPLKNKGEKNENG